MEGKEAEQALENIIKSSSPTPKNKEPQGANRDCPNESDQKQQLINKFYSRCSSLHCPCSKKMRCRYAGGNSSNDVPLESMATANGKPRFRSRPASFPSTVLPLVPLDRMGPLPPAPLLMPPPFLEPARSQGSSTEVKTSDRAKPPNQNQHHQPPQATRGDNSNNKNNNNNNENSIRTAEEFMEVTSARAVKPFFDLNLPPPEYDEWMYS